MIWPDFTTLCGFTSPVYQDVLSKNQSVFDMLHLKRERETVKEKEGGERNEILFAWDFIQGFIKHEGRRKLILYYDYYRNINFCIVCNSLSVTLVSLMNVDPG